MAITDFSQLKKGARNLGRLKFLGTYGQWGIFCLVELKLAAYWLLPVFRQVQLEVQ